VRGGGEKRILWDNVAISGARYERPSAWLCYEIPSHILLSSVL